MGDMFGVLKHLELSKNISFPSLELKKKKHLKIKTRCLLMCPSAIYYF